MENPLTRLNSRFAIFGRFVAAELTDYCWNLCGVASLVAMLSLGIGLQQMASRRLVNPDCSTL